MSRNLGGVMGIVQPGFWCMICTTIVQGLDILVKCQTGLLNKSLFLLWDCKHGGLLDQHSW